MAGSRHHGDETILVQRRELQAIEAQRLEGDAQLDATVAHHLHHLFVDHVVHRHVDPRVGIAECAQRCRQTVAGERRHGRHRHLAHLQGEVLTQQILGVVPVGQQAHGNRQQRLALGRQRHAAGGAHQQLATEGLLQVLDRQAQRRLRQVQALAGLGEAQALRHGEKGA